MVIDVGRRRSLACTAGWLVSGGFGAQAADVPFRMAVSESYAPFYFVENGRVRGIAVDILDAIIRKQMGKRLEFHAFPWARAQMMVQRDGFDALCTIATPERLGYTVASDEAVLTDSQRLFVHKDNPLLPQLRKVRTLAELLALKPRAISYLGSGWAKAKLAETDLVLAGNFDNVMRMMLARRADIMIDGEFNVRYWLASPPDDLGHLNPADLVMMPMVYESSRFVLLVSKQSAHLGMLPEFDARMKRFRSSAEYRQIFQSYGVGLVGS